MATKIFFSKDNANIEPDFCEACTLAKKHKMHSKIPPINTTDESGVYLYADLFSGENILPDIRVYWYRAIFTDKTTQIRFPMTIKLRDAICDESKIFFKKNKIFMGRKM